jgi:tetratricopeptide (TPR) repeat protein
MKRERTAIDGNTLVPVIALCLTVLFTASGSQIPRYDGRRADPQVKRGASLFRAGDLDGARGCFEQAIRLAPDDVEAWKDLGWVYVTQGHWDQAEPAFRRACDLSPKDEDACYALGRTDYALTRLEDAIAAYNAYKKSLQRSRRIWRADNGIALALEGLGRSEDAKRLFREAIKAYDGTANSDFDPRIDYGAFLFRQGRLGEALRELQTAVEALPRSAKAHFELARTLVQLGRLEAAAAHLNAAVTIDPNNGPAQLLLGKVYFRLGRIAEAESHTQIGEKLMAEKP